MDYTRFAVRLLEDLPQLDAITNDRLLVRVGHLDSLLLIRSLPPNYGAVGEAVERGLVLPIDAVSPLEVMRLLACAGAPSSLPPYPPLSLPIRRPPRSHRSPGLHLL